MRAGRTLFYGADDLLASAGFSLEDDALLDIALADTASAMTGRSRRVRAGAAGCGPHDRKLFSKRRSVVRDASGKYDQAAGDRYHDLLDRIGHTPGTSLVAAVRTRSAQAGNEEMADLADLISRHPDGENDRGRPFDADALAAIGALAKDWGDRHVGLRRCEPQPTS